MGMQFRSSFAIAALTAAVLVFGVGDAAAQSCNAMRSELARLSGGGSGAAKSQIAALERQAKANGCRTTSGWGRPRACAGIDARISQLKRQGSVSNPGRVRQLQRAIARNCSQPKPERQVRRSQQKQAPEQQTRNTGGYNPDRMTTHGSVIIHGTRPDNFLGSETKQTTGFFGTLFGGSRRSAPRRDDPNVETVSIDPAEDARKAKQAAVSGGVKGVHGIYRGGGMKTWCVRLCDGFYFPVSYRTSSSAYQRDLAICQHRCPGADVSLYSHPGHLNPENMVSAISGERYTQLPTAFAYRTKVTDNCSCEMTAPDVKSAKADGSETKDPGTEADATTAEADTQTVPQPDDGAAREVEMASVSADVAASQESNADQAENAAADLASNPPSGELNTTGTNVDNTPKTSAVTAYADGNSLAGKETRAEEKVVIDTVARPSADEVGVSQARPITEADLQVRKVGPTYYADQIAASANASQARQAAR